MVPMVTAEDMEVATVVMATAVAVAAAWAWPEV